MRMCLWYTYRRKRNLQIIKSARLELTRTVSEKTYTKVPDHLLHIYLLNLLQELFPLHFRQAFPMSQEMLLAKFAKLLQDSVMTAAIRTVGGHDLARGL